MRKTIPDFWDCLGERLPVCFEHGTSSTSEKQKTSKGELAMSVEEQKAMVAEEDRVAERWTGRGTHRGAFQGIAPTGRQVTVPGFVFYRLASGKITEFRGLFDGLALMQQLGAIPDH
jgi:predicted ester cyclase